jgi:hypothetical protein
LSLHLVVHLAQHVESLGVVEKVGLLGHAQSEIEILYRLVPLVGLFAGPPIDKKSLSYL